MSDDPPGAGDAHSRRNSRSNAEFDELIVDPLYDREGCFGSVFADMLLSERFNGSTSGMLWGPAMHER